MIRIPREASAGRSEPGDVSGAALLLGAGLLLLIGILAPAPAISAWECPHPGEIHASAGWTWNVACTPSADRASLLRGPAKLLFGQALDVNRADPVSLEVLPGIGAARAEAIVRHRELVTIRRLDDLEAIPGIGPKTVEGLRSWATVGKN